MDRVKFLALMAAAGLAAMGQAQPKIGVENETGWSSKYIWRGLVLERRSTIQSDNTIYLGSMSLNIANRGRSLKPAVQMGSDEVDYTLGWETELGGLSLQPSLAYYTFGPHMEDEDTFEAGFTATKEWGGLSLFTNHYLDFKAANGAYYMEAGLGYEKELAPSWTAGATVTLGWGNSKFNAYNFGVNKRATNTLTGELSLTYRWGPAFYVRPWLGLNSLLDHRLRESVSRADSSVWGIAFGFSR